MSTPQPHTHRPPTSKQLRFLRDLALRTGQSFAYPRTAAEASREIGRLKGTPGTPSGDRRRESGQLGRDMAERRGDAARVDVEAELEGYGSTASWSTSVEDEAEEEAAEREAKERLASWR